MGGAREHLNRTGLAAQPPPTAEPPAESERFLEFFAKRAINEEVRRARPYIEFRGCEDVERARELFRDEQLASNQKIDRDFMLGWMAGTWGGAKWRNEEPGGIVIVRNPPPGWPAMSPELKSWSPFPGSVTIHYHGPPTDKALVNPDTGKPMAASQVHRPESRRPHIEGAEHAGDEPSAHRWKDGRWVPWAELTDADREALLVEVHAHFETAKYRFLVGPTKYRTAAHTHERMHKFKLAGGEKADMYEKHLAKRHPGRQPPVDLLHEHEYADRGRGDAARIDVHPLAVPLFAEAEEVFFVIEGCPKADAVLTAILETGRSAAVFSVPSVTLWDGEGWECERELERFVREYGLREKTVYVVPDMDWIGKDEVRKQALFCCTLLNRLGVNVHMAAPPAELGCKGVDDLLVKHSLEDLVVIQRVWDKLAGLSGLSGGTATKAGRRDLVRMAATLEGIALHANDDGELRAPLKTVARIMGVSSRDVSKSLRELVARGAVRAEGSIEASEGHWRGDYFDRGWDWDGDQPVFVVSPQYRAETLDPVPLRAFVPGERRPTVTEREKKKHTELDAIRPHKIRDQRLYGYSSTQIAEAHGLSADYIDDLAPNAKVLRDFAIQYIVLTMDAALSVAEVHRRVQDLVPHSPPSRDTVQRIRNRGTYTPKVQRFLEQNPQLRAEDVFELVAPAYAKPGFVPL